MVSSLLLLHGEAPFAVLRRLAQSPPRVQAVDASHLEVPAGSWPILVGAAGPATGLALQAGTQAAHAAQLQATSLPRELLGVLARERIPAGELDGVVGLAAAGRAALAVQRRRPGRAGWPVVAQARAAVSTASRDGASSTADVAPGAAFAARVGSGLGPQRVGGHETG